MSLADSWGERYLKAGNHEVKVGKYETFKYNSGNRGVKFELTSTWGGGISDVSFVLTEKSLWRLASFADACGMTQEEAKSYDPFDPTSHNRLVGRSVGVVVILGEPAKNGTRYHEVDDWYRMGEKPPLPATPPAPMAESNINDSPPPAHESVPF